MASPHSPSSPLDADADGDGDAPSPAPLPAVAPPAPAALDTDAVTAAQRRLDELAVLMYTYVGVVQRDAPPASRAPDETEEEATDAAARLALSARAPEYARDILRASRAVGEALERIDEEVGSTDGGVREGLIKADEEGREVGESMKAEAEKARSLLESVRKTIAATETGV